MSILIGTLARGGIFQLSEAESIFHPWWDTLEDYSQFSIIMVGLFALPMANNKLVCAKGQEESKAPSVPLPFVNEWCTREHLSLFVSYFPYIIILGPAVLVIIGKFFSKASYGGQKMQKFHSLLLEDNLNMNNLQDMQIQSRRDIKEMRNEFKNSRSFVIGYTVKTLLELFVAISYEFWIIYKSWGNIFTCEGGSCRYMNYAPCTLREVEHECVVPHTHYFFYMLVLVASLNLVCIFSSLWTIIWLFFRKLRRLARQITEYKQAVQKYSKLHDWNPDKTNAILDVYGGLKSPDVELMLDLLAETKGPWAAMRILTLLDQEFLFAWKAQRVNESDVIESHTATITFEGCNMGRYMGEKARGEILYVATIAPTPDESDDSSVQTFVHLPDDVSNEDWAGIWKEGISEKKEKIENASNLKRALKNHNIYTLRYTNLSPGTEYSIMLSTTYSSHEVAEHSVRFTTRPLPPTGLSTRWNFDVHETTVFYKAELRWVPASSSSSSSSLPTYFIEISEGSMSMSNEVTEPYFEHFTEGTQEIRVKLWTVLKDNWKSEECLEETLQPVPQLMRDYVSKLTATMPEEVIGSKYLFQVGLLKKVSKDLRDLYNQIQNATTTKPHHSDVVRRRGRFAEVDDNDDISVTDVFLGRGNYGNLGNLGNSFGLPSID